MSKLSDYEVLSIIGTGSFGTCFKVRNKLTAKLFVWKAINYAHLDPDSHQQLIAEINLLKQLNHPNIVRYFNHIIESAQQIIYIIMECCDGGDLAQLINRCRTNRCYFEEKFIWQVLYQLASALRECHSHSQSLTILHRDVKPANVFLDINGNVKLGDFGVARLLHRNGNDENSYAKTMVGTPFYMSPELIRGNRYNRKSDVWSLGCLIYELCALRPPFDGSQLEQLSENISSGRFNRIPAQYSVDLQRIISFMLNVNHGLRPTIDAILQHPTVLANAANLEITFPNLFPNSEEENMFSSSSPIPIHLSNTQTTNNLRRELFRSSSPSLFVKVVKRSTSDNDLIRHSRNPQEITQEIFNEKLRHRLAVIKTKEHRLKELEQHLKVKQIELRKREQHLKDMEKSQKNRIRKYPNQNIRRNQKNAPDLNNDSSLISVEPNETIVEPTIAKIDNFLPFATGRIPLRNVSFKSPSKYRGKENAEIPFERRFKSQTLKLMRNPQHLPNMNSASTLETKQSLPPPTTQTVPIQTKRKSIFNLFNIKTKSKKSRSNSSSDNKSVANTLKPDESTELISTMKSNDAFATMSRRQNRTNIPTKWTAEHKRNAFEMLAILNAADEVAKSMDDRIECNDGTKETKDQSLIDEMMVNNKIVRHDRKRQTILMFGGGSAENADNFI